MRTAQLRAYFIHGKTSEFYMGGRFEPDHRTADPRTRLTRRMRACGSRLPVSLWDAIPDAPARPSKMDVESIDEASRTAGNVSSRRRRRGSPAYSTIERRS